MPDLIGIGYSSLALSERMHVVVYKCEICVGLILHVWPGTEGPGRLQTPDFWVTSHVREPFQPKGFPR